MNRLSTFALGVLMVAMMLLVGCTKAAPSTPANAGSAVLLQAFGTGSKTTASFTASGPWEAHYTFDCKNFDPQGGGDFSFGVFSEGHVVSAGASTTGISGHDTDFEHATGSLYLSVISECDWTITVLG